MPQRNFRGRCAALSFVLLGLAACATPAPRTTPAGASSTSLIAGPDIFGSVTATQVHPTGRRGEVMASPVAQAGPLPSQPTGDELAFVREVLSDMQRRSFATDRETCGYIGRDAQGRMMASRINTGTEAACYLPAIPAGMRPVASIHTHGRYSPYYASEFPTVQDMTTDAADGINGYIATPGGRLWYVDSDRMVTYQLCQRGCLPQDPAYRPEHDGPVRLSFTLAELQHWERQ